MPQAVITSVQMYADTAVKQPFVPSRFSALVDNDVFQFTQYGDIVNVREVSAGDAIDYDESTGWNDGGNAGSVTLTPFTAVNDRQRVLKVGARQELNSINQNMTPSGVLLMQNFWDKFAAELDAVTCATIFNAIPAGNIKTQAQLPTDKANIMQTLISLKAELYNKQIFGPVLTFIRSSDYANLESFLGTGYGLANNELLNYKIDNRGATIQLNPLSLDNLYFIRVPDDRMISHVILNDGVTSGQTAGGWAPNSAAPGFKNVSVIAFPRVAGALSLRHLVNMFTVPQIALTMSNIRKADLDKAVAEINTMYQGQTEFRQIGIDQLGDQFRWFNRIIYDTAIFNTYKNSIFAITA